MGVPVNKFSFDDVRSVWEYLEKHCQGSSINIRFNPKHELELEAHTTSNEKVIINISPEERKFFPKITKTSRLGDEM